MKRRQKKIVLIGILLLILTLVIISAIIVKNKKEITSTSHNNNQELAQAKSQAISQIEVSQSNSNISDENILQELKTYHNLDSSETNWKKYLNSEAVNSLEEINIRREQLINIINKLSSSPSSPPTPRTPPPSPPSPPCPPPSPPTNPWEKILWEIREFMNSNPQKPQDVKNWLDEKKYPDPLAGINLAGIGMDKLRDYFDNGKLPGLDKEDKNSVEYKYKDYVYLNAAGQGNCYLHSFSIFLTGQDEKLVLPLRVAMCLELMGNLDKYYSFLDDAGKLRHLREKLITHEMTVNYKWLDSEDSEFLAHVLKRPISVINKQGGKVKGADFGKYQVFPYPNTSHVSSFEFNNIKLYDEEWVVYNSGYHFHPLIKKQ